jgi:hypothetical protein
VSHPTLLHHAERLERALEASSQFVAARGPKGWVMRIVAFFACQYARAVIELLEGLLAEYRAGTLILPEMVDDPSTGPARGDPGSQATRPRVPSTPRVRSPSAADVSAAGVSAAGVGAPRAVPAGSPERYVPEPRRPGFGMSPPRPPIRRPEHGPRGLAGHPSVVPRCPVQKFRRWAGGYSHVLIVTISE